MRSECRQVSQLRYIDLGILTALAMILVLFEVAPEMTIGRLSVTTSETEMTGFDAGDLYEIPPELPDDPIDVEKIFNQVIPIEIDPVQVISTSDDTIGLSKVMAVDNPDIATTHGPGDQGIPEPGTFIPHSMPPICTFRPIPEYPEMAKMAGVEGRVILQLFVSVDGVPLEVVLMQSSGLSSMDDSAIESAWASRWNPAARDDGHAVGVWTSVIYEFSLK